MSLLVNPGKWNGNSIVPDEFEVRVIAATHKLDDAVGNATAIAAHSKAWILGNAETIERVKAEGGKPWLLHVLKSEETYEIPGLKITPYALHRRNPDTLDRVENFGLYIEMGGMKVGYLGDTSVRGPFGQLEMDVIIAPISGEDVFPVKDAVSLCIDANPKIAIPTRITDNEQATKFTKYIDQFSRSTLPIVLEKGQTLEIQWAAGNEFRHTIS